MKVSDPDAQFPHVICQIFRHPLCQSGNQYLILLRDFLIHFSNKVINLAFHRTNLYFRIKQAGWTDDLFRPQQFVLFFIGTRSRGYEHDLINLALEFLKT